MLRIKNILKNSIFRERLLIVGIVTALIIIWFRKGVILGSGESGIPFYNTARLVKMIEHLWTDTPLGSRNAVGFSGYPFYYLLTALEGVGVPGFLLQAATYWFIFAIGTLSIHKISTLIKDNTSLGRISAALFYIFNPIVHVSVLHRFQYPMIFYYGFAPLAFLLYYTGLKS